MEGRSVPKHWILPYWIIIIIGRYSKFQLIHTHGYIKDIAGMQQLVAEFLHFSAFRHQRSATLSVYSTMHDDESMMIQNLWSWILICRYKDLLTDWPTYGPIYEQVVILLNYLHFAHNCCAKRDAGLFLLLNHPPDIIYYQPRFVPADHLRLFLGVTPQLHRTKNRPQDTQ